MYTVKQVAAWAKVSSGTVVRWIHDGKLRARKNNNGKWRIYKLSSKALLKSRKKNKSTSKKK
ncbi:helix-turn-helix domain-containing protein [Candidatus Uabimicrobium amorphum]|uniref:Helix-turn-helix domain-containing protein n=1 Tax=Uabimicrobium amorphum TaxID=2596890 RepID=A0A5S9IM64_UABAM|nr:helix-turn-helix domain-containing protein [Candidatus Uabimicrobium amorphum]BBM84448.1 hypothetical protein UABAM_02808 [Candidatus Uabimicrobium amorphum]